MRERLEKEYKSKEARLKTAFKYKGRQRLSAPTAADDTTNGYMGGRIPPQRFNPLRCCMQHLVPLRHGDNTQMHLYMPTESFEKFFANTSVHVMLGNGQLDKNDTEAVAAVYNNVADAVESINLSIVTKAAK